MREIAEAVGLSYQTGAMVNLPRHPSQLYEALFEGVLLFCFLWFVIRRRRKKLPQGFGLAWYVIGYGLVRFIIEYFRSPDENLGYIIALGKESDNIALFQSFFNFSMGQLFCLAMIAGGLLFMFFLSRHKGVKHASHR